MECKTQNKTLYSGAGIFDLSNIVCTPCNNRIRVGGFLVMSESIFNKPVVQSLEHPFVESGRIAGADRSPVRIKRRDNGSHFNPDQALHRSGVLLSGRGFFMSFLQRSLLDTKQKLVINRYYNVVMSRAMSITRQPAPNAYR